MMLVVIKRNCESDMRVDTLAIEDGCRKRMGQETSEPEDCECRWSASIDGDNGMNMHQEASACAELSRMLGMD